MSWQHVCWEHVKREGTRNVSIHKRVAQRRFESPAQKAMVSLLVTAGHLARALEEVCAAHGITHDQYNVLRILRGVHPEGHPRYAIAERLIDRSPDVTRLLDRLEREGFVGRSRSDEDRRLSISLNGPDHLQLSPRPRGGIQTPYSRRPSRRGSLRVHSIYNMLPYINLDGYDEV